MMPTIFDLEESNLSAESKHLKLPVSFPRKSPRKTVHEQDQFNLFEEQDKIKSFRNIDSMLTPPGYAFQKYDNLVVLYRHETVLNVTEVTDCVRVDRDLQVKLFYKGSPLTLPQCFHHGGYCRLRKRYDAKLPTLYDIRGRTDVQYSRRAQRAHIQEKKNIILFDIHSFYVTIHY